MDLFVNLCWRKIPLELSSDLLDCIKYLQNQYFSDMFIAEASRG